MGFLDDCFSSCGLGTQAKSSAVWPMLSHGWERQRGIEAPGDFEGHLNAFEVVSTVCACITRIATDVSSCPLKIYLKPTGKLSQRADVTDAPGFAVFRDPNPHETTIDFWRKSMMFMELFGENYWELVQPKRDRRVAELYSWSPFYMRPIPHPTEFVSGYEMDLRKGQTPKRFGADEMVWIRYPNPLDDYRGLSPLHALRSDIRLFDSAQRWAQSTFKNDVRPSVIVTHKELLGKAEAAAWKTRFQDFHAGLDNAYRAMLLDDGVTAQVVQTSLKDLEFSGLLVWTKGQILSAIGTPPAVMGIFEGPWAIRANTAEQLKWYWQTTVIPKLMMIARVLTEYLLPLWGDRFEAEFDTSHVEVLQEGEDAKHVRLKDQFEHGVVTPNEWREETGREKIDAPSMDSLYLSMALVEIANTRPRRQAELAAQAAAEAQAPKPSELGPTGEEV